MGDHQISKTLNIEIHGDWESTVAFSFKEVTVSLGQQKNLQPGFIMDRTQTSLGKLTFSCPFKRCHLSEDQYKSSVLMYEVYDTVSTTDQYVPSPIYP